MRLPGEKGRRRGAEGKAGGPWLAISERVLSWITGALSTAAAFVVLVAIAGVDQTAAARAAERPALLNEVARFYSLGVGEVRCPSQPEWDADPHRARFS